MEGEHPPPTFSDITAAPAENGGDGETKDEGKVKGASGASRWALVRQHHHKEQAVKMLQQSVEYKTRLFKKRQLFVEMDELHGTGGWKETHRWAFGLEEDLGGSKTKRPHLPQCSAFGLTGLHQLMTSDFTMLDVPGTKFSEVAHQMCQCLVVNGVLNEEQAARIKEMMLTHDDTRNDVTRDDLRSSKTIVLPPPSADVEIPFPSDADAPDDEGDGDDDSLCAVATEEIQDSADILVADIEWINEEFVVFARLDTACDFGLEHRANVKFCALVVGNSSTTGPFPTRHIEIGEALAVLLQDEDFVTMCYGTKEPSEIVGEMEKKMHKLTVVPHFQRPTHKAVQDRTLGLAKDIEEALNDGINAVGTTLANRWSKKEADLDFFHDPSLPNFFTMLRKYSLPLLFGILLALIFKNVNPDWYRNLEPGHHAHCGHHDDHQNDTLWNLTNNDTNGSDHVHHPGPDRFARSEMGDGGNGSGDNAIEDECNSFETPLLFGLSLETHGVTFNFVVVEVFMCFFFGIAVQELAESFLEGGVLYPPTVEKVANPVIATFGGVFGPIAAYFIFLNIFDYAGAFKDSKYNYDDITKGWGITTATDISLGWATALMVFGPGHPGVTYVLLTAIFDDGLGLIIIAIFYGDENRPTQPVWLLLNVVAMLISYGLRRAKVGHWLLYVLAAGPISWFGLYKAAIHPALALVFVVPFMPFSPHGHGHDADEGEGGGHDQGESGGDDDTGGEKVKPPVSPLAHFGEATGGFVDIIVMGLFGLCSAGVDLSSIGPYTLIIVLSLLVGKTLGIGVLGNAMHKMGYPLPPGLTPAAVWLIGLVNSVGLTVALFVAGEAFKDDAEKQIRDEAKLGALLSVSGSILTLIVGKFVDVSIRMPEPGETDAGSEAGIQKMPTVQVEEDAEESDEDIEDTIVAGMMKDIHYMHETTKNMNYMINKHHSGIVRDKSLGHFAARPDDVATATKRPTLQIRSERDSAGILARFSQGTGDMRAQSAPSAPATNKSPSAKASRTSLPSPSIYGPGGGSSESTGVPLSLVQRVLATQNKEGGESKPARAGQAAPPQPTAPLPPTLYLDEGPYRNNTML